MHLKNKKNNKKTLIWAKVSVSKPTLTLNDIKEKQIRGNHNNSYLDSDDNVVEDLNVKKNRLSFAVFFLVLMGSIVLETKWCMLIEPCAMPW